MGKYRQLIMDLNVAIKLENEKVRQGYIKSDYNDLTDKFFEIVSYTDVDYYGTISIIDIKNKYDKGNEIYEVEFYKYNNNKLLKCNLEKMLRTFEYRTEKIFIFI